MKILKTLQELEIGDATVRDMIVQYIRHNLEVPKVYHQGETTDANEWNIDWDEDVKFDESWNLYIPNYTIINFKDNSYSSSETGHNLVRDISFDTEKEYDDEPTATYEEVKEWSANN